VPGHSKQALKTFLIEAITRAGVLVETAEFIGNRADLPCRVSVRYPNGRNRSYNLYFWTISHGGRTRSESEYRIQAKLKESRELSFTGGATVLLGYYDAALDAVARINAPDHADMMVITAWEALRHLKVGASSSCQVNYPVLREAYLAGSASSTRKCGDGTEERVICFRPEYLARYLYLVSDGHRNVLTTNLATEPWEML
jgi:hypothetical protein